MREATLWRKSFTSRIGGESASSTSGRKVSGSKNRKFSGSKQKSRRNNREVGYSHMHLVVGFVLSLCVGLFMNMVLVGNMFYPSQSLSRFYTFSEVMGGVFHLENARILRVAAYQTRLVVT